LIGGRPAFSLPRKTPTCKDFPVLFGLRELSPFLVHGSLFNTQPSHLICPLRDALPHT